MNFLNSQQLAFILDIKKEDARAKMCFAWCADKGIQNRAIRNAKNKIIDDYPGAMPVEMLAVQLNLPTLQAMVDGIVTNYLIRPATRKWILSDYPEKMVKKAQDEGALPKLAIPAGLRSMLPTAIVTQIYDHWLDRYPQFRKPEPQTEMEAEL
jgi:hypothetical protein